MCNEFIDNLGDMELYRRYTIHNSLKDFTRYLCYNTGVRAICKNQKKYDVPKEIENEDIHAFKHKKSKLLGDPYNPDEEDEEDEQYLEGAEEDYLGDNGEEYNDFDDDEYGYDDDYEGEKRLKRSVNKKVTESSRKNVEEDKHRTNENSKTKEKLQKYTLNLQPPPLPSVEESRKRGEL